MAALTTLADVKAVAQKSPEIQAMHKGDLAVKNALALAEKNITEERFGAQAFDAQTYFVAHILALAATEAGGKGPLSTESIGGVSQSFTLPYLNQHTVIASTQYGLMYLEIRDNVTVPAMIIKPT